MIRQGKIKETNLVKKLEKKSLNPIHKQPFKKSPFLSTNIKTIKSSLIKNISKNNINKDNNIAKTDFIKRNKSFTQFLKKRNIQPKPKIIFKTNKKDSFILKLETIEVKESFLENLLKETSNNYRQFTYKRYAFSNKFRKSLFKKLKKLKQNPILKKRFYFKFKIKQKSKITKMNSKIFYLSRLNENNENKTEYYSISCTDSLIDNENITDIGKKLSDFDFDKTLSLSSFDDCCIFKNKTHKYDHLKNCIINNVEKYSFHEIENYENSILNISNCCLKTVKSDSLILRIEKQTPIYFTKCMELNTHTSIDINCERFSISKLSLKTIDSKRSLTLIKVENSKISKINFASDKAKLNNCLSEPYLKLYKTKNKNKIKNMFSFSMNKNNNRSSYVENKSATSSSFSSILNKNENSDNSVSINFDEQFVNILPLTQQINNFETEFNSKNTHNIREGILSNYLSSNLDENEKENTIKTKSKSSEAYLILPSLFDKHEKKLLELFSKGQDDTYLPEQIDKRLIGEVMYQLDQRIFNFIFQINPLSRRDLKNGYEVLDLVSTIYNLSFDQTKNRISKCKLNGYMNRYNYLMKSLQEIGYIFDIHQNVTGLLIMKYGLFPSLPIELQINFQNKSQLELFIILAMNLEEDEKEFLFVLYLSLLLMTFEDQQSLFRFK